MPKLSIFTLELINKSPVKGTKSKLLWVLKKVTQQI